MTRWAPASSLALQSADADSSYTLAYDAARFACTALPAQQGLRPTTKGGHYAVEQAVRAQFQTHFPHLRNAATPPQ